MNNMLSPNSIFPLYPLNLSTIYCNVAYSRCIFVLYFHVILQKMNSSSSQQKRKPSGRPQSEVWKHYEKTPLKSSPGHFSAKCNYCKNVWTRGHVHELEDHLANKCKESPEIVSSFY